MDGCSPKADVLAIIDEAMMAGPDADFGDATMPDILNELIARAEADKAPMTFLAHARAVYEALDALGKWQAANPDRVKAPD